MTQARKRFGQNFLTDAGVLQTLITYINPKKNEHLLEIGPGRGALTQYLTPSCQTLTLIEIDRDLVGNLVQHLPHHCQLICADACTLSLPPWQHPRRLIGNLPYNVATQIILRYLALDIIQDCHVMVQKEVAQRICAPVNTAAYGRLSVICQYLAETEILLTLPPDVFSPQPKVDSSFIRLTPRPYPIQAKDFECLSQTVKKSFSQRRKMLRSIWPNLPKEAWDAAHIDPSWRAQACKVDHFVRLANWLVNQE